MFERRFTNDKMLNARPTAFSQTSVLNEILRNNYCGLTFLKLFVSSVTFEKQYQSRKAISVSEIQYVYGALNLELGQHDRFWFDLIWFSGNSLQYPLRY